MSTTDKKVELSELNDEELNLYFSERLKKFKLTIAICGIYGVIALILLLLALFTSWGNRVLYDEMAAFVFTYIFGTVIIIIYLSNEIYNFKPKKGDDKLGYDSEMCPDYWKLEVMETDRFYDSTGKHFLNRELNPNQFKYKCNLDNALFPPSKFREIDATKPDNQRKNYKIDDNNKLYIKLNKEVTGINDDTEYDAFKIVAANMSGYTYSNAGISKNNEMSIVDTDETFDENSVPLTCNSVYPLYLSVLDNENYKKNPFGPKNKYRCAYAKSCGIPWTEAGCT